MTHLGPPINLVAGLLGMPWLAFSLVGALGEVVWVFGFVMLGYAFSQSILAISPRLGDLPGFLQREPSRSFWRSASRWRHFESPTHDDSWRHKAFEINALCLRECSPNSFRSAT